MFEIIFGAQLWIFLNQWVIRSCLTLLNMECWFVTPSKWVRRDSLPARTASLPSPILVTPGVYLAPLWYSWQPPRWAHGYSSSLPSRLERSVVLALSSGHLGRQGSFEVSGNAYFSALRTGSCLSSTMRGSLQSSAVISTCDHYKNYELTILYTILCTKDSKSGV